MNRIVHSMMILAATCGGFCTALGQGTAFAYQGRLTDNGSPASGNYDLPFVLFDAASDGSARGGTNTLAPLPATGGVFAVTLDIRSAAFDGGERWLQIVVRTGGSAGACTPLAPRRPLTPVPYASTAARSTGAVADY